MGWVDGDPLALTTGIREAYRNGLAIAVPVDSGVVGWAMVDDAGTEGEGE